MIRVILTWGEVITDLRTDDDLTIDGLETFTRLAYERHEQAIAFATAIQANA